MPQPHDERPTNPALNPARPRLLPAVVALTLLFVALARLSLRGAGDQASESTVVRTAAAAELPDAPPLPDPKEDLQPGLTLTFFPAGAKTDDPAAGDSRSARLVSLYVPAGTAPSAFLDPGPFVAVWEGNLNMRLRDYYRFAAEGRGKLTVTVNGAAALEASGDDLSAKEGNAVQLKKGKNKVVVRYDSPDKGDATVRLRWTPMSKQGSDFTPGDRLTETVPPTVWSHDVGATPVAKGLRLREGRQLLADLRCTKCHAAPGAAAAPAATLPVEPAEAAKVAGMPELSMDAPSLADLGARLNRDWITAWVNNPRALRPTAHMPRVFQAAGAADALDPRAADVAAYLASLGKTDEKPAEPVADAVNAGGKLFAHLNCIACHTAPNTGAAPAATDAPAGEEGAAGAAPAAGAPEGPPRIPLKYVKAKFKPAALQAFLLKPEAHYAWIPMPNFHFAKPEAEHLAAFLLASAADKVDAPGAIPKGDATKGKQLVASSGCLNCHAIGNDKSELKAPALADIPKDGWSRGCLAKDDASRKAAPDFALTDAQRDALVAFAATDRSSLKREAAPEFAERQIVAMRCTACHARDGKESDLATTLDQELKDLEAKFPAPGGEGEAFSPDQRPPQLTWAGEKLNPQWMAHFIGGQVPYKPRPYLHARMPAFTARAGLIAAGLAESHGHAPVDPPREKSDPALATIGQKLAGKTPNQAFGCVQCHAVANLPPFAPFEAPALNLSYVADRLQKDYYHRWIHNPLRLDPNTKMPAFERDDGKTTIMVFYDGDAKKQFEAVWHYLLEGKDIKPPAD